MTKPRECVLQTVLRVLREHAWPGMRAVVIEAPWAERAAVLPGTTRQVEVRIRIAIADDHALELDRDAVDAWIVAPIIDECFDFGRGGYASASIASSAADALMPSSDAVVVVRDGSSWRTA